MLLSLGQFSPLRYLCRESFATGSVYILLCVLFTVEQSIGGLPGYAIINTSYMKGGTGPMNKDSYRDMLARVQAFHDKHDFANTGGEELTYRVALMAEELGEISSCVTKGKDTALLAEECADLMILVMGTAIAADFDLCQAFWDKMDKIMQRESRMVNGRIRVSEFRE